ncbi:MAG: methylamine utilization protein [Rheinheimera sp.]
MLLNYICSRGGLSAMLVCMLFLSAPMVKAAPQQVLITDQQGQPLADAVVELLDPANKAYRNKPAEVAQQDLTFRPFVSAVQAGTPVDFPNQDKTRHHVYSFSPAKVFELKLYADKPEAPVLFDTPGVVALGCNIHDYMQAYVYVGESPFLAVTNEQGIATFDAMPAGAYQLKLWHPWQDQDVSAQSVTLPLNSAEFKITVTRQEKPTRPKKGFGNNY